MPVSEIKYIKNEFIDYEKWDFCIDNSSCGIVYGKTWYLDRVSLNWDALIWGDYLYVMPLVYSRKYGINYIYQPFFTQQLGVFSAFEISSEIVNSFLKSIPNKFLKIDMKLNIGNRPTIDSFILKKNTTFFLNLENSMSVISEKFRNNTIRNIRKAESNKISITNEYNVDLFIDFTRKNLNIKSPEVKTIHYNNLKNVINHALYYNLGEIYCAYDRTNTLVAAAFFLKSNNKIIYLAASSNETGTTQSAMFLLVQKFIEINSGNELILDFEGSNLPGIARFYSGFGAEGGTYYSVHISPINRILNIMKS